MITKGPHEHGSDCGGNLDQGDNLDQSGSRMNQFTAAVVHDLRGPLNIIANGIAVLQRSLGKTLGLSGGKVLKTMGKSVARMNELITEILVFSKVQNEGSQLELVDLNKTIHSILTDLQQSIRSNCAKISVKSLPSVCGDASHLRQLFQNLIENSLKYRRSDVAPEIVIASHPLTPDPLTPKLTCWEISLVDNGRGFTNKEAETIFEPFRRLNNPGIDGSGIGLATCERVVKRHGGTIRAEGTPGIGAKFFIQLPSLECCEKTHSCQFALASTSKKCPALKRLSVRPLPNT